MIFDTDILIWVQRGNVKAADIIEAETERLISIYTYMELLQGAKSKQQHTLTKEFLHGCNFKILPLTENIGHRAAIYLEEYAVSSGLRVGDALIAASATENGLILCTSNIKHFKSIHELELRPFKPVKP